MLEMGLHYDFNMISQGIISMTICYANDVTCGNLVGSATRCVIFVENCLCNITKSPCFEFKF